MLSLVELHNWSTLVPIVWLADFGKPNDVSLFLVKCPVVFSSPAGDYVETRLDPNDYLVKHRASTFMFDVCGHSMRNIGIFDGDNIVVDRAVEARHNDIIVAIMNGEHTVKRLYAVHGIVELRAESPLYRPIRLNDCQGKYVGKADREPSTHPA